MSDSRQPLLVRIELVREGRMKFRFHQRSGQMIPDKPVPPDCPAHYGAVLNTVGTDGEPLDAFVIGEPLAAVGQTLEASVAGCIFRADGDHKLLMTTEGALLDEKALSGICAWAAQFERIVGVGTSASAWTLTQATMPPDNRPALVPPTWMEKADEGTRRQADTVRQLVSPRAPLVLMPDAQYDAPFLGGVPVPVPMELGWVLPFCLERSQDGFRLLSTNVRWDDLTASDCYRLAVELDRILGPESPERIEVSHRANMESVFNYGTLASDHRHHGEQVEPIRPLWESAWQPAELESTRRLLGASGEWGHCLEVGRFTQVASAHGHRLQTGQLNVLIHLGSRFLWPLLREEALRRVAYRSAELTSTRHAAWAGLLPLPYWEPDMAAYLDRFYAGMRFGQANREAVELLVGIALERVLPGARVSLVSDTIHVALEPVTYCGEPVLLHRNGQHRVDASRLTAILGGIGAPTAIVRAGPRAAWSEGLVPHGNPEPEPALRSVKPDDPDYSLLCNTYEAIPHSTVAYQRSHAFVSDLVEKGLIDVVAWSEPVINLRGRKRDQPARIYGGRSDHSRAAGTADRS